MFFDEHYCTFKYMVIHSKRYWPSPLWGEPDWYWQRKWTYGDSSVSS